MQFSVLRSVSPDDTPLVTSILFSGPHPSMDFDGANKSVAAGIVTCNKKNLAVQKSSHSNGTGNKTTTHLGHTPVSLSCRRGIHPFFVLRPAQRAQHRPGRCRGGKSQHGHLVAVRTPSHRHHSQSRASHASHTHWPSNVCRH